MRTKPFTAAICLAVAFSTAVAFAPAAMADAAGDTSTGGDELVISSAPSEATYAPRIKKGYTFTSGKATYKVVKLGKATKTVTDYTDGSYSTAYAFTGSVELVSYKGGKKANVPAQVKSPALIGTQDDGSKVTESASFSVTSIGKGAFDNAKGRKIVSVSVGKNITSIGDKAFYKCKSLKKIVLKGDKIRTIGPNSDVKLSRNSKSYVKQLYKLRTKKWKTCSTFEGVPRHCEIKLPNINPSHGLKYNIEYANAIRLLAGNAKYYGVVR